MHKSAPVFFRAAGEQIDSEAGVIKDIVIIQGGKDKYGENWDTTALEQIVEMGNAQGLGVKSRFGHPNMCDTTLGSFIGRYKNHRIGTTTRTDNGETKEVPCVLADLHMDTIAKESPKGNLYDYILGMSQRNSDMFGNSIVYIPNEPERKTEQQPDGTSKEIEYQRVNSYLASDLVDSPAATDSLFKDTTNFAATATQFLDENPEIFDLVSKNETVVREFLIKYANNKHTQPEMKNEKSKSLLQRAREYMAGILKEAVTVDTADGNKINIDCANGTEPAVGDSVTDTEGNAVPNASIDLANGQTLTTDQDGKITEIKATADDSSETPTTETPAETPSTQTDQAELEALRTENARLREENETLRNENTEANSELEALHTEMETINVKLEKISAQVKSTATLDEGSANFRRKPGTKPARTKEEIKEYIKNRNAAKK
jgi:hypothetical protein